MALKPLDEVHALQIQAGTVGRHAGHKFELALAERINALKCPIRIRALDGHLFTGDPSELLLHYVAKRYGMRTVAAASAISTGALATSEQGKQWLSVNGVEVSRCKSDIVLTLRRDSGQDITVGVSTKQCSNSSSTNAQLYFTTARGFASLLERNGIRVSERAVRSLRQFCGDVGFRPMDDGVQDRQTDPRRYFWEEIDEVGRKEWERLLSESQAEISRLLFQKAYLDDPFVPEYLLHKARKAESWGATEVAMYSIDELIDVSMRYQRFALKSYSVKKGSYKDPAGVEHLAPRFGIIQMQRGGQAQHPDQLQFNLEAGYFYKLEQLIEQQVP